MKKVLIAMAVGAVALSLAGCASKAEQNAKHYYIWKGDLPHIHREWDSWGPWDQEDSQPSRLSPYRDF